MNHPPLIRRHAWIVGLLVLVASSVQAGTFPVTGTTSTSFTDPVDGTLTASGNEWVTFGTNNNTSALGTHGVSYSTDSCDPFAAATFGYYNGGSSNTPAQVTFEVKTK